MTDVKLHDYWRSSASYRVRIALELKGIAYRRVSTDLVAGEQRDAGYLERNPQGFVPMLEIDGLRLTQSLAIVEYLDLTHSAPPLVPRDPAARARVTAMALTIACDIHPLNNLRVLNYLGDAGLDKDARDRWYRHWVTQGLGPLEALAAGGSTYLGGDTPGLAELCLVPQLYNARRFDVDLTPYPTLVAVDARCAALPSFQRASPDAVRPL